MGGAFTAIRDNLAAMNFNPATFDQYQTSKNFRMTFYLNPLASLINLYDAGAFSKDKKELASSEVLRTAGLFIKAITFSIKSFECGLNFCEESLANQALNRREKFFAANSVWIDYSHAFTIRLKLAPQVAIGSTTTFYRLKSDSTQNWETGSSYGVLMHPDKKISVGVFYIALPKSLEDHRHQLERLTHDTVNIGLAYQPNPSLKFSIDIRNINQEKENASCEPHFGAEYVWDSWLAFRSGYYQVRPARQCYSVGVGLLSSNLFLKSDNYLSADPFIFNYTLVYEKEQQELALWHFFAFVLRL